MTIDDAGQLPEGTVVEADVCVIGSGAAGITVAHELDGSSIRVVVLEAGGFKRDLKAEQELFSIEQLGEPQRNPEAPRARMFGGSTNLWFGRIAALDPIDFEQRNWIPHSGWPLGPAELGPFLDKAARLLAVPEFGRIDIRTWDGNPTAETFRAADGLDVGVFLWSDAMVMGDHRRDAITRSGNVRLLLRATATDLVAGEGSDIIEEITVARPDGRHFSVRARQVVLAAGGLENPRLLLASTGRSPSGIGNEHDLVGRFYMDHPRGEGLATASLTDVSPDVAERLTFLGERTSSEHGTVQLRVTFSEQTQRDEQLLNHALHAHLVAAGQDSEGFRSAKRLVQRLRSKGAVEQEQRWTDDLRAIAGDAPALLQLGVAKLTRRARPDHIVFIDQMEQPPDPLSRVTVDPRRPDRFGLPRLELDWRIDDSTYRSQRRMHELVGASLATVGLDTFTSRVLDEPDARPELWDMKHPSGTTRMAETADRGVVDADGRVHGVDNLYVAGSSVFPTVGHANPTLTIVALAMRLATTLRARLGADAATSSGGRGNAGRSTASARLGVGCARLGEATGGVSWRQSVAILRRAADHGITYFDTADAYVSGTSERLVGAALCGRRTDVTIATKAGYLFRPRSLYEARVRFAIGPLIERLGRRAVESATGEEGKFAAQDFSPDALRAAVDASLRRMRTDHIDLFQLHAPRDVDVDAVMAVADDLRAAGKIHRFGIGVEQLEEVEPWVDLPGVHSVQLPFSILDRRAAPIMARVHERGGSIVARSVLGGGSLVRVAGAEHAVDGLRAALHELAARHRVTVMQLAIAYAASRPPVDVVLVGIRTPDQLEGLLAAAGAAAPPMDLVAELEQLVADDPGMVTGP